jgi:hypothetical protein
VGEGGRSCSEGRCRRGRNCAAAHGGVVHRLVHAGDPEQVHGDAFGKLTTEVQRLSADLDIGNGVPRCNLWPN